MYICLFDKHLSEMVVYRLSSVVIIEFTELTK